MSYSVPDAAADAAGMADPLHVRLFAAATLLIDGGNWHSRNVHDSFWRLYVNAEEGARLELPGGRAFTLRAGRLYFVPAGVRFDCVATAPIHHFYLHFDVLGVSEGLREALFSMPFAAPASAGLHREIAQLAELLQPDGQHGGRLDLALACRLKSLIYTHLAAYLQQVPASLLDCVAALNEACRPLMPALRYIDTHLGDPLTIAILAGQCHFSEDYFIRRFRTSLGRSPIHYVQERRVAWAAQRLLFSDASIEAIASEAGFGNRFYFSRIFTRVLAVSPAAYRRAQRI